MAYADRWKFEDNNPETSTTWSATIQERDYGGSSTDLRPAISPFRIKYKRIDAFKNTHVWHVASSICTVHYIDDGTGLLADILQGDDEQFKLIVKEGSTVQWTGFVQVDSYTHPLYRKGEAIITASDRLEVLSKRPYMESDTVFYAGRVNVQEILYKLLTKTGLALGMNTHCMIAPYLTTNGLDPTTDDVLEKLLLDQDNLIDADGLAYSCMYVLEQILVSLNLQLFQAAGEWCVISRRRNVRDVSGTDKYKVFTYSANNSTSSTLEVDAYRTANYSNDNTLIAPSAGGMPPVGKLSSIYFHGDPFEGVFANFGFEEALRETVQGTPLVDGASQTGTTLDIDGITTPSAIPVGYRFTIAGDSTEYRTTEASLVTAGAATLTITPALTASPSDNAAITFYESVGGWEIDDTIASGTIIRSNNRAQEGSLSLRLDTKYQASGASAETTYLTDSATQTGALDVGGGANVQHRITIWLSVDDNILAPGNTLNWYFDYKVGSYYYDHQNTSTWASSQPDSYVQLDGRPFNNDGFFAVTITTPPLIDGVTPIDGTPEIILRNAVEGNDAGGATQNYVYIDAIEIVEIDENGEPSNAATKNTVFNTSTVNRFELPTPVQIIGEGPSTAHVGRYTVLDSTGAEVATEGSWFFATSDDTDISLEAFVLNEKLTQMQRSMRKITASMVSSDSSPPTPLQQLKIENPADTLQPPYSWNTLEYSPSNPLNVMQGEFAELEIGKSADKFCSYDIKPDSLAVKGIDPEAGLSCSEGDPIYFPGSEFTHVYALTYGGNGDGGVFKYERDDGDVGSGTWTETELTTFTTSGTFVNFMRVHEADEYFFTVLQTSGDWDLYRHNLDGTGGTVIYSSALANEITGMDIDREGRYLYLTRESSSLGSLTRVDFSGNSTDLYTTSIPAGGTFKGAMWDRSTKCYFFIDDGSVGASIYLYAYDTFSGTTSQISGPWDASFGNDRQYGVGNATRGYLLFNPLTGANGSSITKIPLPAAASASYPVGAPGAPERGCAMDWNAENYFYAPGSGQVNRKNIDGTGDTHIATASNGDDIYDLCVGV